MSDKRKSERKRAMTTRAGEALQQWISENLSLLSLA
jgi:hypothetical protein